jgi:hypothetical protein
MKFNTLYEVILYVIHYNINFIFLFVFRNLNAKYIYLVVLLF